MSLRRACDDREAEHDQQRQHADAEKAAGTPGMAPAALEHRAGAVATSTRRTSRELAIG
ncbi:MAG: hypothetical protein LC790_00005 [Actinobacteria bacterium]|nr:hypothetical protein [Actinomycetota bacterium]